MIRADHCTFKCSVPPEQIRPLEDRMIVKPDVPTHMGRIEIPEAYRAQIGPAGRRPTTGTVISIGAGERSRKGVLLPTELKPGDRVLFSELAGDGIVINGEKYLAMCEGDVLGVLEDEGQPCEA